MRSFVPLFAVLLIASAIACGSYHFEIGNLGGGGEPAYGQFISGYSTDAVAPLDPDGNHTLGLTFSFNDDGRSMTGLEWTVSNPSGAIVASGFKSYARGTWPSGSTVKERLVLPPDLVGALTLVIRVTDDRGGGSNYCGSPFRAALAGTFEAAGSLLGTGTLAAPISDYEFLVYHGPGQAVPVERWDTRGTGMAMALPGGTPLAFGPAVTVSPGNGPLLAGGADGEGVPQATALFFDKNRPSFGQTANLATARADHAAIGLSNGDVMVAGGRGPGGERLASVEIWSPLTGTWRQGAPMAQARSHFQLLALPDGRILAAGGLGASGEPLAAAELFSPGPGTWTAAPSLATARASYFGASLENGKAVLAGGRGPAGLLASVEVYSETQGAWAQAGPMAAARQRGGAALLGDGTVLLAGGVDGAGNPLALAERFDPAGMNCLAAAPLPAPGADVWAFRMPGGCALVMAGSGGVLLFR